MAEAPPAQQDTRACAACKADDHEHCDNDWDQLKPLRRCYCVQCHPRPWLYPSASVVEEAPHEQQDIRKVFGLQGISDEDLVRMARGEPIGEAPVSTEVKTDAAPAELGATPPAIPGTGQAQDTPSLAPEPAQGAAENLVLPRVAAKRLGIKTATVRAYMKEGTLRSVDGLVLEESLKLRLRSAKNYKRYKQGK